MPAPRPECCETPARGSPRGRRARTSRRWRAAWRTDCSFNVPSADYKHVSEAPRRDSSRGDVKLFRLVDAAEDAVTDTDAGHDCRADGEPEVGPAALRVQRPL